MEHVPLLGQRFIFTILTHFRQFSDFYTTMKYGVPFGDNSTNTKIYVFFLLQNKIIIFGLIPGGGKIFLSFPQYPYQLWSHLASLTVSTRVSFPGDEVARA